MPQLIRTLIEQFGKTSSKQPDDRDLKIAAALLLVEVGQADSEWQPSETTTIVNRLAELFDLSRDEAEGLLEEARQRDAEHVSLHPTLKLINAHFTSAQKQQIIIDCWRVALADGVLDHYEEHQIRRIADLLHLPHSAFIRAKLHAQEERS